MKHVLIVSSRGDFLAVAQRIQEEGHKVTLYINDPKYQPVGQGLVDKSPVTHQLVTPQGEVDRRIADALLFSKPDLVIFDTNWHLAGKLSEWVREQGINTIGTSMLSDRLALNHSYAQKLIGLSGISSGVSKGAIEISTDGWFNGKELLGLSYSLDELELMEGGLGPMCKGMGSLSWAGKQEDRLYQLGLKKLLPMLEHAKYKGPISLLSSITKDKLSGVGILARFKYNSIFPFFEGLSGRVGDFLHSIASGIEAAAKVKSGYFLSVSIVVQPYPLVVKFDPVVLYGFNKDNLKHTWFNDIRLEEFYICNGITGDVASITARGDSIRESKRRVYRTINNLTIPQVMYRRDIGDKFSDDLQKLRVWKWLS